jgi:hypothetical protein
VEEIRSLGFFSKEKRKLRELTKRGKISKDKNR